ncbi:MAG: hypothetical protein IK027_03390 [Deltaproteobacteria bacterium]|nr:hypothetical protein [Deltaproteobacteria bacterium]
MKFSDEQIKKQDEAIAAMEEQMSKLESLEKTLRKSLEGGLQTMKKHGIPQMKGDLNNVPPELAEQIKAAQMEAKRQGAAAATQSAAATAPATSGGSKRKGVVRA